MKEFGGNSLLNNNINENNISNKKKYNKDKNSSFLFQTSNVYRALIQKFSSGVTLRELTSIAIIICQINPEIKGPNRNEKRNYNLLINWFSANWEYLSPLLPLIELRDENNEVINGQRELNEMYK